MRFRSRNPPLETRRRVRVLQYALLAVLVLVTLVLVYLAVTSGR